VERQNRQAVGINPLNIQHPLSPDSPPSPPIETDALIIGAGPAGLFQVFQLGLQEIRCHVVDALPHAGGQCVELYGDKPIYDIPALPVCTGKELVKNLLTQIKPFDTPFHFSQTVTQLEKLADGSFAIATSTGTRFLAKTVFIAAGVGAFAPKKLSVAGLDAFEGHQLLHHVDNAALLSGKHVVINGDNDSALDWALRLCAGNPDGFAHKAASVILIHRRDVLNAEASTVDRFRSLVQIGALNFVVGQITGFEHSATSTEAEPSLGALQIAQPDATIATLPLDTLLVLQGLSPKLGAVAHWGLDMERRQLQVDTEKFSTSEPGIFAVGDINTYPGKKKLILCAFHECVLAAFAAAPLVHPERKVLLEYTTTSTRLHKVLGV
jgi:thioredoxin reductase (NADPH)